MKMLTVREPFGGHAAGAQIKDQAEVEAILASPHAHHVIVSAIADQPDDGPKPAVKGKA